MTTESGLLLGMTGGFEEDIGVALNDDEDLDVLGNV